MPRAQVFDQAAKVSVHLLENSADPIGAIGEPITRLFAPRSSLVNSTASFQVGDEGDVGLILTTQPASTQPQPATTTQPPGSAAVGLLPSLFAVLTAAIVL